MKNNKNTNKNRNTKETFGCMSKYVTPDAIIGNPIITPSGTVIIPVSKLSMGLCLGKGEYGEVKVFSPNKNYPNVNAEGGIVSMKPFGFLIETKKGVRFISLPETYMDKTMDAIMNFLGEKNEKK